MSIAFSTWSSYHNAREAVTLVDLLAVMANTMSIINCVSHEAKDYLFLWMSHETDLGRGR